MTDPVDPVGRAPRAARAARQRRAAQRSEDAAPAAALPVPSGPAYTPPPRPAAAADAAFAAHLMAGKTPRGLKGGPEALEQAHSTYLETEFSGMKDRRAKVGRAAKTDI